MLNTARVGFRRGEEQWASDEDVKCCGCPWVEGPVDVFRASWVIFSLGLTAFWSVSGYSICSVFSILEAVQMK